MGISQQAMREGWHYSQRLRRASKFLCPANVDHCVIYACPWDIDAPAKVMHPSPMFVAGLMAGGIHPPIEAVMQKRLLLVTDRGERIEATHVSAPAIRARHKIVFEQVADNSAEHLSAAMAMTYPQAIEHCIMRDVPREVWAAPRNRRQFAIIQKSAVADRSMRNAWRMGDIAA